MNSNEVSSSFGDPDTGMLTFLVDDGTWIAGDFDTHGLMIILR